MRLLVADAHIRLRRARLSYGHGTTNAWDEAVYLTLYALRLPLDNLELFLTREVRPAEQRRLEKLLRMRIEQRIPAAYITREAWLGDFRFYVDRRVIVPRSYIAELILEQLAPWITAAHRIRRALDLCTGSGCLAVLVAQAFRTHVDATDISRAALAVAQRNVETYRLRERISLVHSDMFAALADARYDLIVANPPYVNARKMRALPPEHRREPRGALAGGEDGMDFVRVILDRAERHLTANGLLVVELGHNRREIERDFPNLPFVWPQTSGGDDCVFMLWRDDLARLPQAPPAHAQPHRTRPASASLRRPRALRAGRA